MKKIFKTLGITALVTVIYLLMAGCQDMPGEGVELGNHGGLSIDDAYNLTEGKWTFGYTSSPSHSRFFSVPVTNGQRIWIYISKYDYLGQPRNINYFILESGTKHGPYNTFQNYIPNYTGQCFIEVVYKNINDNFGNSERTFAITYINSSRSPGSPRFWN